MNLAESIRSAIERHQLIPEGTNVVLGVSGGADSVALLHAFHRLRIPCTVAHLNHGLRGDDSDGDEHFVRELAAGLGMPCVCHSVNVHSYAAASGLSIEMAARKARHTFFAEFDNSVIALAHHADDQVETFLLRLARGAGTEGLAGMAYAQTIGPIRLIRPMLAVSHSDIVQWLEAENLPWREDASNADPTYLRNRVRHTLLPMLENELNPNIRKTILRTMDILREENTWMENQIDGLILTDDIPVAARRRLLRKWLFEQGAEQVDLQAVNAILEQMVAGKGSSIYELNDRQRVVIEYGTPRFEESGCGNHRPPLQLTTEPGTGWRRDHGRGAGVLPAEASFNAEKVGNDPIEVRFYEPGDRISPFGMEGSRKLQDIFTDQKIPQARRSTIPVVTCRGELIWLPGYRIAREWKVAGDTEKSIHVRIEHNRDL